MILTNNCSLDLSEKLKREINFPQALYELADIYENSNHEVIYSQRDGYVFRPRLYQIIEWFALEKNIDFNVIYNPNLDSYIWRICRFEVGSPVYMGSNKDESEAYEEGIKKCIELCCG